MRKMIKKSTILVLSIIAISSFIACSDDTDEIPGEGNEPTMLSIGFGLALTPQDGIGAKDVTVKAEPLHNYVKDGYTVSITGGVTESDAIHYDVNLNDVLSVEIVGDIQVTVSHPAFDSNALVEEAYFGIESYSIPYDQNNESIIDLELVQGFVLVTAQDAEVTDLINSVMILGQTAELNTVYYTGQQEIEVKVETVGNTLIGRHSNVIGEGVQYMVTSSSEGIEFTFPVFGTPGDGDWNLNP